MDAMASKKSDSTGARLHSKAGGAAYPFDPSVRIRMVDIGEEASQVTKVFRRIVVIHRT
jgi:hypothetical protein